jgi:hypothetical protein
MIGRPAAAGDQKIDNVLDFVAVLLSMRVTASSDQYDGLVPSWAAWIPLQCFEGTNQCFWPYADCVPC